MFSLTNLSSLLLSSSRIIDRWTIELGDINAGGSPIWPQSDGARGPFVVVATFVVALALLLSVFLSVEEELKMPKSGKSPPKTAETPANELPFPGKLVEGKYDVQHLHL